jgi:hypothetical protein
MLKILVVVLAGAALWGLYLLNGAVRSLLLAGSSVGWPKVEGLVVRTEDVRHDNVYSSQAIVRYNASDGNMYSTDQLAFGETLNPFDRPTAGLFRLRYPDGAKVSVSYDPSHPQFAVLNPGLRAGVFWPLGVSLAFLLPVAFCLMQYSAVSARLERRSASASAFSDLVDRAKREGVSEVEVPIEPDAPIPMPDFGPVGAIVAATLASLACAGGVLLLANGLPKTFYGFASRGWPTTPGEVITNVGLQAMSARQSLHNTVILPPGMVYRYQVSGTAHVNSVRRFRSVKSGDNLAQAMADAPEDLPVGTKVQVAYFPSDPDISALEPGNSREDFILPGIGIVLLLFSASIFIWGVPSLL